MITRLEERRERYEGDGDAAGEIRLTSLIGAIRVNKKPPETGVSEQISYLQKMELRTKEEEYIRNQELLALYLLKPTFSLDDRTEFFSLWVKLHSDKGRPSDVDPGIWQEAEQRAFVERALIQGKTDGIENILNRCSASTSQTRWNVDDFPRCIRGGEEINLALGTRITNKTGTSFLTPAIEETLLFKKLGLKQGLQWIFTENEAHSKKTYTCAEHPGISIEADSPGNVRFLKTIKEDGKSTQYVCFDPVYKAEPRKMGFLASIRAETNAQVTDVAGYASWQITLSEKHRPYVLDNVVLVEDTKPKRGSTQTLKVILDETTSIQIILSGKKSSVQLVCKDKPPVSLLHISPSTANILGRLDDRMYAASDGKTTTVIMPLLRFPNEPNGLILEQSDQGVWEVKHDSLKGYQISANLSPIEPSHTNPPIIPPGFTSFMALEKSGNPGAVDKILFPAVELKPKYPKHVPGEERKEEKSYSSFMTEVEVSPPGNCPMTLLAVDVRDGKPFSSDRTTNAYLAYIALSQHRYADACAFLEKSRATLPPEQLKEIYGFILDWPDTSAEGEKVKDRVRLIQLGWQSSPSSSALVQKNIKKFEEKLRPQGKAETFLEQHPIGDVTQLQSLLEAEGSVVLSKRLTPPAPPAAVLKPVAEKGLALASQEPVMKEVCIYDSFSMPRFEESLKLRGDKSVQSLRGKACIMIDGMKGEKIDQRRREALSADVTKHCDDLEKEVVLKDDVKLSEIQISLENRKKSLNHQKQLFHKKIIAMCNPTKAGLAPMQEALSPKTHKHEIGRILGSYIRGDKDLEDLLKGIEPPINIEDLKKLLGEYLEASIALKHTEDAFEKISKAPKDGPARQDALDEIATLLDAKRHVPEGVDEQTRRLLRMLEYSCGFILRKANVELVLNLLKNPTCVRQLPPGSGKTKVVLRLLAIMRANGTDLSTIILPEWLYGQNRQELDTGLRDVIGQEAYCPRCSRGQGFKPRRIASYVWMFAGNGAQQRSSPHNKDKLARSP